MLALTPIAVAVSRHNNPDALLVLCVVGALWAVVRGLEDGRVRWMVLAGVFVGLGFSTKMGAALLVVPALTVAWVWAAPRRRVRGLLGRRARDGRRGWRVAAAGGADAGVVAALDLGHVGQLDLVADHRLQRPRPARRPGRWAGRRRWAAAAAVLFGGDPGVFRLLNAALGGQAGWLLGFALVAGVALVVSSRLPRRDPVTGWVLAVGGSALTAAVAFSTATGIFHPYYVSELAPFVAALVGAGVVRFAAGDLLARIAGPLAIAAGVIDRAQGPRGQRGLARVAAAGAGRRRRDRGGRARLRPGRPHPQRGAGDRAGDAADRAGDLVGPDARPRHIGHVPGRRPGQRGHGRHGRSRGGGGRGGFGGGGRAARRPA